MKTREELVQKVQDIVAEGTSVNSLAGEIGMDTSTLWRILQGQRKAGYETLLKLDAWSRKRRTRKERE